MTDHYYFIGIGGIGMSGLARILREKNCQVSGSDLVTSPVTDQLIGCGIQVNIGHAAKNIRPEMIVIYSTDIKEDNPEFQAAKQFNCPLKHRSELLQTLMGQGGIAVAGSHGKTTSSALLAWVLSSAKMAPSFAVGGVLSNFQSNAAYGKGTYFVAEACESDGSFLNYHPFAALITNIDFDHMDYYRNETTLLDAFKKFASQVTSDHLFWCGDDFRLRQMDLNGSSYGFGKHCDWRVARFYQKGWSVTLDIEWKEKSFKGVQAALIGTHNVLNCLGVFAMAYSLGIPESEIRSALINFKGVGRRCEFKGEVEGVLVLDDYAHHPTEIKSTLDAIRKAIGERRLVVAYQSHRYTRSQDCIGKYSRCFDQADALFMTEIYSAGEKPIPGITDELVCADIQKDLRIPVHFYPKEQFVERVAQYLRPHDVFVTLGAGDITVFGPQVLEMLRQKGINKWKVGVIYGGASVEHEVSLKSAATICSSISPHYYQVEQFKITRSGHWTRSDINQMVEPEIQELPIPAEVMSRLYACDILFPVLHGKNGEDGTIQGFFEMLGKPYVGCCVRASAICMDKAATKRLMCENQVATTPFLEISRLRWMEGQETVKQQILAEFIFPMFVKPSHLGSSIGVRKVESFDGLQGAIENAFRYDTHILVENEVKGRELEFAIFGNESLVIFPPGEICAGQRVYDYVGKYTAGNSTPTFPIADLSEHLVQEGIQFAEKAYRAAGCSGMARVDVFLDNEGKYWLNEINPIPGFTPLSLYPMMCEANGLDKAKLIDQLIILGMERKRNVDKLETVPQI